MFTMYHEKISRRLSRFRKKLIYSAKKPCKYTLPVFILGCGRSGTTMMINIFHRDSQVEALGENDPKSARNFMLEHHRIQDAIITSKSPFLIMKPILNSFQVSHLLKAYSNSKILWMLRDFRDMISSSMAQFGNKVSEYMKNFIMHGESDNWLSRDMPLESREFISTLDTLNFSPSDWMAMVWWSVNKTVIMDKLFECDRFRLIEYETLVRNPQALLKSTYKFIGLQYQEKILKYIHSAAIGKGEAIELNSDVEKLCQSLTNQLIQYAKI